MATFVTVDDMRVFAPDVDEAKAQQMIDRATALARSYAPCIASPTFIDLDVVKAILLDALERWNDAGSGALASQTAGPFAQTVDTRQERRGMFTGREIDQLKSLCSVVGVYSVSLTGPDPV